MLTYFIIVAFFALQQSALCFYLLHKLGKKNHIIEEQASLLRLYATAMDSPLNPESSQRSNLTPRTKLFDTRSRQATARHLERQR